MEHGIYAMSTRDYWRQNFEARGSMFHEMPIPGSACTWGKQRIQT